MESHIFFTLPLISSSSPAHLPQASCHHEIMASANTTDAQRILEELRLVIPTQNKNIRSQHPTSKLRTPCKDGCSQGSHLSMLAQHLSLQARRSLIEVTEDKLMTLSSGSKAQQWVVMNGAAANRFGDEIRGKIHIDVFPPKSLQQEKALLP